MAAQIQRWLGWFSQWLEQQCRLSVFASSRARVTTLATMIDFFEDLTVAPAVWSWGRSTSGVVDVWNGGEVFAEKHSTDPRLQAPDSPTWQQSCVQDKDVGCSSGQNAWVQNLATQDACEHWSWCGSLADAQR